MLKHQYDKQEDIPEPYRELYSEKGEIWEITGISGLKTQGDVDRLQTALTKERGEHKETKGKLGVWGELKHDEVVASLDRIPELEAAAKGKLDENEIEEIVSRRVEGKLKSTLAPVERQNKELLKERDELKTERDQLAKDKGRRQLHDTVRPLMVDMKILPDHHEDVLMYAERHLEPVEDNGGFRSRDGIGITPGLLPKDWLEELSSKRPGWLPGSHGGGARGSGTSGRSGGKNPWSVEGWNMTEQGRYFQEHGTEKAKAMAKAAGTTLGGQRPAPKAS